MSMPSCSSCFSSLSLVEADLLIIDSIQQGDTFLARKLLMTLAFISIERRRLYYRTFYISQAQNQYIINHEAQHFYSFYIYKYHLKMNNSQAYIQHQLNLSKTKETHRFAKAPRFPKSKRVNTQTIYNIPTTIDKKTTSFGYGNKSTFSYNKYSVAPGTYNAPSDFQRKQFKNTPSIYEGREKCVFGSFLLEALKRNKNNPSPDRYNVKQIKTILGGNIGERIKTQTSEKQYKNIPGPGTYNLNAMEIGQKGHYILSNFKNTVSPRYHSVCYSLKRDRLNKKSIDSGSSGDLRNKGNNQDQKYTITRAITFSKAKRAGLEDKTKLRIPGFKYKRFSQFGINS